ncbi:MAG: hypothetical protein LUG45_11445, partial [Clostridiales bacterium]|nr:hypothetical protein [Clostridiales bacterium]
LQNLEIRQDYPQGVCPRLTALLILRFCAFLRSAGRQGGAKLRKCRLTAMANSSYARMQGAMAVGHASRRRKFPCNPLSSIYSEVPQDTEIGTAFCKTICSVLQKAK